ncbi:hypothetical protein ABW19_dt0200479 [Dactylella cylindrospora]|nr:hypothetical protein ABW19_dt0200479 [Dactylella cylindrospora]
MRRSREPSSSQQPTLPLSPEPSCTPPLSRKRKAPSGDGRDSEEPKQKNSTGRDRVNIRASPTDSAPSSRRSNAVKDELIEKLTFLLNAKEVEFNQQRYRIRVLRQKVEALEEEKTTWETEQPQQSQEAPKAKRDAAVQCDGEDADLLQQQNKSREEELLAQILDFNRQQEVLENDRKVLETTCRKLTRERDILGEKHEGLLSKLHTEQEASRKASSMLHIERTEKQAIHSSLQENIVLKDEIASKLEVEKLSTIQLSSQLQDAQKSISEQQKLIRAQQKNLAVQHKSLTEQHKGFTEHFKTITGLRKSIEDQEKTISSLRHSLASRDKDAEVRFRTIESLRMALHEKEQQAQVTSSSLTSLQKELRRERNGLERTINDLQEGRRKFAMENLDLRQEQGRLQQQLANSDREIGELRKRNHSLSLDLQATTHAKLNEGKMLEAKLDTHKRKQEVLVSSLEDARMQHEELAAKLLTQERTIQSLQDAVATQDALNNTVLEKLRQCQDENKRLYQEKEAYQANIRKQATILTERSDAGNNSQTLFKTENDTKAQLITPTETTWFD